ncbi:MAG: M13 family metallopeptidase [Gammaproteobacteria bacterium]
MRYLITGLACLLLAGCETDPELTPAADQRLGFSPADLSTTLSAADDFFGFVNSEWLNRTEIPADWSSYGVMQMLAEQAELQLRAIVDEGSRQDSDPGSDVQKIVDLYQSFMATDAVDTLGIRPLTDELERIDALASHDELIAYLGRALGLGIQVPLDFYIDADATNPNQPLSYFWQSGLGMPDRDYYLEDNPKLVDVRARYQDHIEKMHELAGWKDSATAAATVLAVETQIAEQQWTRVQNRDRERIYRNQYNQAEAAALSPGFDWPAFLVAGGFGEQERLVIAQTDYFQALGTLLQETSMKDWRTYLRFKLLKAHARYLSEPFVEEDFDFQRRILRGQKEIKPRWKRGIRLLNGAIGELIGKEYVARHFPPESKARVQELVENLRLAFGASIDELEWMSEATRQEARDKLEKFSYKIGYPDIWRDYTALEIRPDDLAGNVRRARKFEHDRQLAKLGKPVDRSEWGMTPQTVNAYYRPTWNEIVFPAAILQAPFFDPTADNALNYGAIGAVIGHEFSHGFDDQGRKFDGTGRLRDWWTEEDAAEYESRAQGLVDQYSSFQPLPDLAINGELTLGENIADLAGLTMAYRAYEISLDGNPAPIIEGFNAEQRFFIGYAQSWRSQYRDELLREILLSDPHSPARYRVTGVLRNTPEFYRAFTVEEGAGMYLAPNDRVQIW